MQKIVEPLPGLTLQPRLRIFEGQELVLGAGKILLLRTLHETGSISEAARRMQISYNHAWTLLRSVNQHFTEPVVSKTRGGAGGGGAMLTETGIKILSYYDAMVAASLAATTKPWGELKKLMRSQKARSLQGKMAAEES